MDAKADMHRQMSDDYGKNISGLILSVLVSCTWTQASELCCINVSSDSGSLP